MNKNDGNSRKERTVKPKKGSPVAGQVPPQYFENYNHYESDESLARKNTTQTQENLSKQVLIQRQRNQHCNNILMRLLLSAENYAIRNGYSKERKYSL